MSKILKLGLVAGILGGGFWASQGRVPHPAPTPTPFVWIPPSPDAAATETATAKPNVIRMIDLDRPGVPVYMDEASPIDIKIRALAPFGNYRSQVVGGLFGAVLPVAKAHIPNLPLPEAACGPRQLAFKEVIQAPTPGVAIRLAKAFLDAPEASRCGPLEPMFQQSLEDLSPRVGTYVEPIEGVNQKLVIQRLDDAGVVVQTLEWPILPPVKALAVTETQWIVQEVADRIAALVGEKRRLVARLAPSGSTMIELTDETGAPLARVDSALGVWSPESYASVTKIASIPRRATAEMAHSNGVLHALATPVIETLLSINHELELALRADRLSPPAHEASALLLVSVAMRAPRSGFEDLRPLMNRATAHLAVAAAASGGRTGVEGELARVALEILSGRQVPGATRVEALRPRLKSVAALAWYRSLTMRATGDWRVHRSGHGGSLLERVEYARALARSWSPDRAAAFAALEKKFPNTALWGRAVSARESVSVELGNQWTATQVERELAEAESLSRRLGERDVARWLQVEGATTGLAPLSPGLWARLAEASLADAVWRLDTHLGGLPPSPARVDLRMRIIGQYPGSPVMQALFAWWALDSVSTTVPANCDLLTQGLRVDPFRLNARVMNMAVMGCQHLGRSIPTVEAHLTPWVPHGTLFDLWNRLEIPGLFEGVSTADWPRLRKLTFYEPQVLGFSIGGDGRDPASSDYRTFKRELGYSISMLRDWRFVTSSRGRIEEALEPGRQACLLDISECAPLVSILRSQGFA